MMNRWAKRSPDEILDYSKRLTRGIFRVQHIAERKLDLKDAETQQAAKKRNGR